MQISDIDPHAKYLVLTVLLLLPVVAAHNLAVPEQERSFGMCDHSTACQGIEAGDTCLGIQKRQVSCVDPMNAAEHRRAEAECALDAQAICNANPAMTGTDWTDSPNATYNGQECSEWAASDDRIELLSCDQTFDDIRQWTG
ncbi:MAG: hypothetical protein SVW77_03940 [Candidatus Nanohaloarchaea archaeon]|nr:hypothetical protein [Candidatus Nanohaloarchaea archaeon]